MRHRSKRHSFEELLNAEKARIEAALESTDQGLQRELLELKLRRIETAFQIDDWVSSVGLQPPKKTHHERHAGQPREAPQLEGAAGRLES